MDELDNLIDDVVRVRGINYIKYTLFDSSYFLFYASMYENCLIKDIIFQFKGDKIIMSELAINVVQVFDNTDYGINFFNATGSEWMNMKPIELAAILYTHLIKIYGEENWQSGIKKYRLTDT